MSNNNFSSQYPAEKSLDFDFQFSGLEVITFIQCFSSVYSYLEATKYPGQFFDTDAGGTCCGCWRPGKCNKDSSAAKRCMYFAIFNTMTGNSAMRRNFDGTPTEIQKLYGEGPKIGGLIDSDFVVDFLFGYTGYTYEKCTDANAFKDKIIASINNGNPVIVKTKPSFWSEDTSPLLIVTGYDTNGVVLAGAHDIYNNDTTPPTLTKKAIVPSYDDIDFIIVFGEKAERKYTLVDGLQNIKRVIEFCRNEKLWDEYIEKVSNLHAISREERKARAETMGNTNMFMYNIVTFQQAFAPGRMNNNEVHAEFLNPDLHKNYDLINDTNEKMLGAGKSAWRLNNHKTHETDDPVILANASKLACAVIEAAKEADDELHSIISYFIDLLTLSEPERTQATSDFNKRWEKVLVANEFKRIRQSSFPPSVSQFEVYNTSAESVETARAGTNLARQEGAKPIAINSVASRFANLTSGNFDASDDGNRWSSDMTDGLLDEAEVDWINTKNTWFGADLGAVTTINSVIVTETAAIGFGADMRRTIGDWVVEVASDIDNPNENRTLSADGWTVVASGSGVGQGQAKLISFAATQARFVRMRTVSTKMG